MTKIRNVLIGPILSIVLVSIVSCGGGGGGDSTAAATYTVGGTIAGSTGTVVLKLNGGSDIPMAAPGNFTFTGLATGATYNVQVVTPTQRCTVVNGAGTMAAANIANVTVSCGAQAAQMVIRSARLTGATQNPPVATNASGVGGIIVDPATMAITGGITFAGLTPTAGNYHIHQAPSGNATADGLVIIGLTLAGDGVTATVPPATTLTAPQYAALLAGELYFNVHTVANPLGEIRGQINLQGGVHTGLASLNGAQQVPSNASIATGQGTLIVDAATRTILISYITHNVTNADMAHIHAALGPGTNGGVIVGFNLGTNIATPPAGAQMTAQDVANLLVNYLYFNVHSNAFPNGEIRGDITVQ
jgi:hypothetical protein